MLNSQTRQQLSAITFTRMGWILSEASCEPLGAEQGPSSMGRHLRWGGVAGGPHRVKTFREEEMMEKNEAKP